MQYRLFPTKHQQRLLDETLESCRLVYNQTLAHRKEAWEQHHETLSLYETNSLLTQWKRERPALCQVHSQVLQNVQERVDLAYKAFFRRVKAGDTPGYQRYRGPGRYDSFTFKQSGFALHDGLLRVSKVGALRLHLAQAIADAAWGQFVTITTDKAAWAGRRVVQVNPRYTLQRCSRCGQHVQKSLAVRQHQCPTCQLAMDRDQNAAINILRLGLQSLGFASKSSRL